MGCCSSWLDDIDIETKDTKKNNELLYQEILVQGSTPNVETDLENSCVLEYKFLKEIGKGAMSHVYVVENQNTKDHFAAKVYNTPQLYRQSFGEEPLYMAINRQIDVLSKVPHRYILSIIEVIDMPNSYIIIMPYAQNGTLQSQIINKTISYESILICFHQVAEALRVLHANNIVHRDVKPDNILSFTEEYFVISDLSDSYELQSADQMLCDTKGSPAFLSPEECSGNPFYPKQTDVWSYGVSLYFAIFGYLPFNLQKAQGITLANTIIIVTQLLEKEELEFGDDVQLDPSLKLLLEGTLNKDPSKRPTFEEIVKYECFKDAWAIDKANILQERLLEEEEENNT
ncbi:CAMK family protein kinase [Histomonas meleagridis]|uniref:CAMK family protein kinase n=1 Tax=Histomonas meleagridis TaxID=135588 RepID=UPI00355AABED|nr:CAMK family protein kinase [Histomonas meleagridis]KAH0806675.1 CAMK family protein kinase [Histomonas meleagridis]